MTWPGPDGTTVQLEALVIPLTDIRGGMLGASISFLDLTEWLHLRGELERANQELQTAYEELQSTNEELRTLNDQLEQRCRVTLKSLRGSRGEAKVLLLMEESPRAEYTAAEAGDPGNRGDAASV